MRPTSTAEVRVCRLPTEVALSLVYRHCLMSIFMRLHVGISMTMEAFVQLFAAAILLFQCTLQRYFRDVACN